MITLSARCTTAVVLLLFPVIALADLEGIVLEVRDGDSLTLSTRGETYKVRLADIDAPEMSQPYGKDSRTSLRHLCLLRKAEVATLGNDRYGRVLGRVRCAGVDAQAEQVSRGMAWVFDKYAPRHSPLYGLQSDAKLARRGLWEDSEPIAPWNFRKAKRIGEAK